MRKHLQEPRSNQKNHLNYYPLLLLISLAMWLWTFLVLSVFVPIRFIVDKVLSIKYGDRYGGLMDRADSLYLQHNPAMETYNTIIMVIKAEKGKDFLDHISKKMKEDIFAKGDDYKKLTGSVNVFLGYAFIIKGSAKVSDVLVEMEKPKTEPFDMNYVEKYIAEKNSHRVSSTDKGKIMWEVHICKEPLDGSIDGYDRFIFVVRFHHGLSDATSLMALAIRILGNDQAQNYSDELFKKLFKSNLPEKKTVIEMLKINLKKSMNFFQIWLTALFLSNGRNQLMNPLKKRDKSALHGPKLSGRKIIATIVEEKPECIPLIKQMRQCNRSIRFTNVLLTAVAHSFIRFFRRNKQPVPDFLSGLHTILLDFSLNDPKKPVPLKNKTAAAFFELPMTHKTHTLYESLVKVSENMISQIQYSDLLITKLSIVDLAGYLPINLFSWIYGLQAQTFLLTNIPGGSTIRLTDDFVMEKCLGVAPNMTGIGISITIVSYDDRFQIGLQVDQAIINSQEEVAEMAEDILTTIRKLGQEVLQR